MSQSALPPAMNASARARVIRAMRASDEYDELLAVVSVGPDPRERGEEEGGNEAADDVEGHHETGLGLQGDVPHEGILDEGRAQE